MKVAIIDDLLEYRNEIRSCIHRFFSDIYTDEMLYIDEFCCGEDFLTVFRKDAYDFVFIDQYMERLSGIDTAKVVRQIDELVMLIFITTSREHAVESYQVRASGYLVKPFSYEEFKQTMVLAGVSKLRNARFISVQNEKILLREILWCDIDGHYVQVHTQQRGVLRYRVPFATLSDKLINYPQFLNCYKGCLINLEHVEAIDELEFILISGERILFSKRDKKRIENEYHTYLFHKAREDELL